MQLPGCGAQPNAALPAITAPVSAKRLYEPYRETRTLYDPSKGRSFAKIRESGEIAFSEYENSLIKETNQIHSRSRSAARIRRITYACLSNPPQCIIRPPEPQIATWTVNDDFRSLSARLSVQGRPRSYYDEQVRQAISSTQQAAFDQALNAYDLLTELGELRETVSYLGSKLKGGADLVSKFRDKDPDAWKQGRRSTPRTLLKSSDAVLRKLGGRWMEYRYALMPLLYSFKDISEVLEEKAFRYHSERSSSRINVDYEPGAPSDFEGLLVRSQGSIVVRSLTKARYDAGDLQRLVSVVGLNPFRTAWELIPLSFVVDWFLNVGEAITSLTGVDYAGQRAGVTSVRETSIFTYTHHDDWLYEYHNRPEGVVNPCGQPVPVDTHVQHTKSVKDVRQVETNSYKRYLWSRPSPEIIFDPFLNWKRFVDAFVLGYQPTKKILRSLK